MKETTINAITIGIVALINMMQGYFVYVTHKNVGLLEKNTNSMKDLLVETTRNLAYREGGADERVASDERAKAVIVEDKKK